MSRRSRFGVRFRIALVGAFLGSTSVGVAHAQTTVFHGAVLIDGTGGPPIRDAIIVVNDSIIACVGQATACSSYLQQDGIERVDVTGKWIIPGLIDLHVHLTAPCCQLESPPAERPGMLLRYGVTTARDAGAWTDSARARATYGLGHGQVERMADLVEHLARSNPAGPRIHYCGPALSGREDTARRPEVNNNIRLGARGDVPAAVRYLADRGASCIKLFGGQTPRHMRSVLEAAAAVGIAGIGHSTPNLPLAAQLEWPWAEIHHLDFPAEELLPPGRRTRLPTSPWARMLVGRVQFDPAAQEAAELARRVAQHGLAWVPTLTVARGPCDAGCWQLIRATAAPGDSAIVSEAVFDAASLPRSASDSVEATRAANLRFVNQWIALLHATGVPILAGSDSPAGGQFGSALHTELEYLVAAGLSPMAALAAATGNAAAALGVSHRVGTVSARKLADFIVLDADPLADIRNSRAIHFVVFNGAVIGVEAGAPGPRT